jgi:hypothetical protein
VNCHQAGLPKVHHSTNDSKELTDGSNAVQQQGFAIVSMTRQARNSDPATPTVVQDAILLDLLVRSAKDAPSPVPINIPWGRVTKRAFSQISKMRF